MPERPGPRFIETRKGVGTISCKLCEHLEKKPIPSNTIGEYLFKYECSQARQPLKSDTPTAKVLYPQGKLAKILTSPKVVVISNSPEQPYFVCPNPEVADNAK